MKLADRAVVWDSMTAEEAAQTVRFSDSSPGCPHAVAGARYRLFGARTEGGNAMIEAGETALDAAPGEPVGEGSVRTWVSGPPSLTGHIFGVAVFLLCPHRHCCC